ncbi:hypothetical protein [Rhodovibrio salinarum]|uniref:Uncharacterized protein n=1 Tax=Rhodovibrio salinarum TaxID=1087 RepID=A0A934QM71_9PROT|nr:hypothetical protein [Rhodovibrio salinarum]MBK1699035.1 hypothetical protein [Rhodovibrio salinarum]
MTRPVTGDPRPSALPHVSNDNQNIDPGGLMTAVLQERGGLDPAHTAHDFLIGWLLELPADLDPAIAARQLLAKSPMSSASGRAHRVAELLAETAAHPRARAHASRRRSVSRRPG